MGESSSPGSGSPSRRALSEGGTATTIPSASSSSRDATRVPSEISAPRRRELGAGRVAVHLAERSRREQQVARSTAGEERGLHGEDAWRGAHLVRPKVERRPDEDVPEAVDACLRLAECPKQRAERLVVVSAGIELRELARHAPRREPLAQADVPVTQKPDEPRADGRDASVLGDNWEPEPHAPNRRGLADLRDEVQIRGAAPEGDVLAVVRRRARVTLPFRQGLHRPAERRPRLEEADVVALLRELERRREPGEPTADDRDPHSATTAFIFSTVERWGGSLKTS